MCKGLAICVNIEGKVICRGLGSHDETKKELNGDKWLDYEIILPDIHNPREDLGDTTCIRLYREQGFLNKKNKVKSKYRKAIKDYIRNNELRIRKYFNENMDLLNNQEVKGNMSCIDQEVKGNMDCSGQKVKGNMNCSNQEVKGHIVCSGQKVKGNMYCSNQEVKGDMSCSGQEVKGNMYCSNQKVEGSMSCVDQRVERHMNCSHQIVKGHMYCHDQEVGGDMNCSHQIVKGKVYIRNMEIGENKKINKLIEKYSEIYYNNNKILDFESFVLELIKR